MRSHFSILASSLLSLACGGPLEAQPTDGALEQSITGTGEVVTPPPCVVFEREMVITAPGVVDDPVRTQYLGNGAASDGVWSFGRLMERLLPAGTAESELWSLLQSWHQTSNYTVNNNLMSPRDMMLDKVLADWWFASQAIGSPTDISLKVAPFRLLAITNRMDMRNLSKGNAGEARFVFGFIDTVAPTTKPDLYFILEYKLPATTVADVQQWANRWHTLRSLTPGTAAYRTALEAITNQFTGIAPGTTVQLGQLRTEDGYLGTAQPSWSVTMYPIQGVGPWWQFRQFHLNTTTGHFEGEPVSDTPSGHDLAGNSINGSTVLGNWVNQNQPALQAGMAVMPAVFQGQPFLGGEDKIFSNVIFHAPNITNNNARYRMARNTCSGCHSVEAGNSPRISMISNRLPGQASSLSPFLSGQTTQLDAWDLTTTRTVNERQRRIDDFTRLACPTGTISVDVGHPAD